tara:strand:+ start:526 stop:708 length:183 start_codon:yes stop_codon:yes gene_type:complete
MGILDNITQKYISRKFLVFLIGTALAIFGNLTSNDWVIVSSIYIGSQAIVDLAKIYRGNK